MLPSRRGVDVIDGQVQTPLVRNSKLVPMGSTIFRRFESNFPFQVYVPCSKEAVIRIGVKSSDGHAKFRVVSDDLVRRLLLRVQRKKWSYLSVCAHASSCRCRNGSHAGIPYISCQQILHRIDIYGRR